MKYCIFNSFRLCLNFQLRENDDEKILLLFGQIRLLALEMIVGFNYIHDISLIHTDIKIDNVMIVKFLYSDTDLGEVILFKCMGVKT